ncbi:MAG: sterol desaturase family protein [Alphaproteobacteria bacterium]|nr:sterol desaturase family protein [Alphaproteobacteria bacterium]
MELFDLSGLLFSAAIFIPLERLIPRNKDQRLLRPLIRLDLAYIFFNGLIIRVASVAFVVAGVTIGAKLTPSAWIDSVSSLPVIVQVFAIIVVVDLGLYFVHRAFHEVPILWRIHAIHHSIEDLDWLAGYRIHPIDQIFTRTMTYTPAFMLGFSDTAVYISFLIYHWQSLFIHSNVNINLGPFRWLAASPEFHHWHHANEKEALDKNFAAQLPFIDVIFGTAFMPLNRRPKRYGTDTPTPKTYLAQVIEPLRPAKTPPPIGQTDNPHDRNVHSAPGQ